MRLGEIIQERTVLVLETVLSLAGICLAIAWVTLPRSNLEPFIVLVMSLMAFVPLYIHHIRPGIDGWRLGRQGFRFLSSAKPINAVEGSAVEFERGISLRLKRQRVPNYPSHAAVFFEQTGLRLVVDYSPAVRVDLYPSFSTGNHDGDEVRLPKQENSYFLAQYDVTGNDVDEIIFGVITPSDNRYDIEIQIFEYHPPYFSSDVQRRENWRKYDGLIAQAISGEPNVILDMRTISVPRNFRRLEYKWVYAEQKVLYVGTA